MTTEPRAPASVISIRSPFDFDTTVQRIKAALAAKGMTLFADIDQALAASGAGTFLRPTRLLLFGNPKGGTPVMQANPHAALELPLRTVIWQDDGGQVIVDYQDPVRTLEELYGLDSQLLQAFSRTPALLRAALDL